VRGFEGFNFISFTFFKVHFIFAVFANVAKKCK